MNARADERWIQKARVIGGEDERSFQRHALGIEHPPMEIGGVDRAKEAPAEEVDEVHARKPRRKIPSSKFQVPKTFPTSNLRSKRRLGLGTWNLELGTFIFPAPTAL